MNIFIHLLRQAILFTVSYTFGGMIAKAARETKPTCDHKLCRRFHWLFHANIFFVGLILILFLAHQSGCVIDAYFPL